MRCSLSSSGSRRPARWASAKSATHSVAVRKATRWPARQARMAKAMLRWVLPVPGGPSRTTFLAAVQEVELAEVNDRGLLDRALEGKVELLQRLVRREARLLDAGLAAVAVAAVDLGLKDGGDELLVAPLVLAGALDERGQRPRSGRRLEGAEQVRELGGRAGHAISWS